MEELHAIVSGRVQMVMYRDFTKRTARALGLFGMVRNVPDGTVEVIAQGKKGALEQLLVHLKEGPLLSRVEKVEARWRKPSSPFTSFDIVYHSLIDRI